MSLQQTYETVWQHPDYGRVSPGEQMLPLFRQMVKRKGTLIDIGCGCARATQHLEDEGHTVTGIDFVDARETDVPFQHADITNPLPLTADVGYCCDVMEHIPEEDVDKVLQNIMAATTRTFFSISFEHDHYGAVTVGHPLHLTVRPFTWWRDKLKEFGELKEARDLIGMGVFLVRS